MKENTDGRVGKNGYYIDYSFYKKKIIEMYVDNGWPVKKIAKLLKLSEKSIHIALGKYGIQYTPRKHKQYSCNEFYFDKIDSHEKAYWLGFLYADGSISDNGVFIQLKDGSSEMALLLKFLSSIGANNPIRQYQSTYFYKGKERIKKALSVGVYSSHMAHALHNLGCVRNKTYSLKFPTYKTVGKKYFSSFIRGFFDGDGCIHIRKDTKTYRFVILGLKQFIYSLKKFLEENVGMNHLEVSYRNQDKTLRFCSLYTGHSLDCEKFKKYIYKDCDGLCLSRKKELFDLVFEKVLRNDRVKIEAKIIQHLKSHINIAPFLFRRKYGGKRHTIERAFRSLRKRGVICLHSTVGLKHYYGLSKI